MLLVERYAPGEIVIAALNPVGWVLLIGLAFFLYRFLPNLIMRPSETLKRSRTFFEKYRPGLKQTWRGLLACMFLLGATLNVLELLFACDRRSSRRDEGRQQYGMGGDHQVER